MKQIRRTKAQMIRSLLDMGVVKNEDHILSLEVSIDRLKEKLPMTQKGMILWGYYSNELIVARNQKIASAKVKGVGKGNAPRTEEHKRRIAEGQKARWAAVRAAKAKK